MAENERIPSDATVREAVPDPPGGTWFVFDDEPLESVLYGESGAGPTVADLFANTEPIVSVIVRAFEKGEADEGLLAMARLFTRGDPVTVPNLLRLTVSIAPLIPHIPCPIVEERNVPYDVLLEHLFAAGLANDEDLLTERSGHALFRFYEGCGRYTDAARVVGNLLDWAIRKGNRLDEAIYTNNLGYDHLLNRDWLRAARCFARAEKMFGEEGQGFERVNARMNLLLARYERFRSEPSARFERELSRILTALGEDWRRRKALMLLARIAERRGDLETAIQNARQAVAAGEGLPTRHFLEDREYLERLEERRKEGP